MRLFDGFKKKLSFQIVEFDLAPDELAAQLPIEFTVERTLCGSDRPDYTLAACRTPLRCEGRAIRYLVVAPRFVGQQLNETTREIVLGVALVTDESVLKDPVLSFEKCRYMAIGKAVR